MPYQKYIDFGSVQSIFRVSDSAWIPLDVQNTDYHQFLKYLTDNDLTINDIPVYQS